MPTWVRILRTAAVGLLIGLVAWCGDSVLLGAAGRAALWAGLAGLLALTGAAIGALAGVALWLGDVVARRLRWTRLPPWLLRPAVDAAIALPAIAQLGRKVFAGRGLAASALHSSGPWLFLAAALTGVAVASMLLRALHVRLTTTWGAPARALAVAGAGAIAVALIAAERTQPIDGYFYLHVTALLLAMVPALMTLDAALPPFGTRTTAAALATATLLFVAFDPTASGDDRLRLYAKPLIAGRVTQGVRLSWDRDGDGFSPALGGGDCDDGDNLTNPLALDRPGDGVDQDCDGVDATEPQAPPPLPLCADTPQVAAARDALRGADLLVIIVDALREDFTEAETGPMPGLASLAQSGVRFRRVVTPATSTSWAIPASLAGRMRVTEGGPPDTATAPPTPTLIESLRSAGYHTGMALLDDSERVFGPLLDRFDSLASVHTSTKSVSVGSGVTDWTADALTDAALAWVDEAPPEHPFALVVHPMDAHQWYRIEDPALDEAAARGGDAARYEAILRRIDHSLTDLIEGLRARGRADHLLIAVFADHGEGLGVRGITTHGRHVYPVLSRVPLILAGPGLSPRRVDSTIGLVDLAPTLTDLLSLPPIPTATGRSVAPLALGAPSDACDRPVFSLDIVQVGVAWRDRMLTVMPFSNTVELLDLGALPPAPGDPLVERNLAAREPAMTKQLLGWLRWRLDPQATNPIRLPWHR